MLLQWMPLEATVGLEKEALQPLAVGARF